MNTYSSDNNVENVSTVCLNTKSGDSFMNEHDSTPNYSQTNGDDYAPFYSDSLHLRNQGGGTCSSEERIANDATCYSSTHSQATTNRVETTGLLGTNKEKEMRILLIGDDNFTFTPCFLESVHFNSQMNCIEVTSCLTEDKIPNDFRPNYLALTSEGVKVHFGINPAQLRNHFFHHEYNRIIFILPGIGFSGFPLHFDKKNDPLFRLRLHIFCFSFFKSSRNALQPDGLLQLLWPIQDNKNELPAAVPWHSIEISKIGPFCEVFRSKADDEILDTNAFHEWHPLIHNKLQDCFPKYLHHCQFYSWRLSPVSQDVNNQVDGLSKDESGDVVEDTKECNLLFVPPGLWKFSIHTLSHVNELFKFEMKTHDGEVVVVSKPTLKFDPRFRSDGGLAKNPLMKSSNKVRNRRVGCSTLPEESCTSSCQPPPPPPPPLLDCSMSMLGDGTNATSYVPNNFPYPSQDVMVSMMHEQQSRWVLPHPVPWDSGERFLSNEATMDIQSMGYPPDAPNVNNSLMRSSWIPANPSILDVHGCQDVSMFYSNAPYTCNVPISQHGCRETYNNAMKPPHEDVLLYESLDQPPYGYEETYGYSPSALYENYSLKDKNMSSHPIKKQHESLQNDTFSFHGADFHHSDTSTKKSGQNTIRGVADEPRHTISHSISSDPGGGPHDRDYTNNTHLKKTGNFHMSTQNELQSTHQSYHEYNMYDNHHTKKLNKHVPVKNVSSSNLRRSSIDCKEGGVIETKDHDHFFNKVSSTHMSPMFSNHVSSLTRSNEKFNDLHSAPHTSEHRSHTSQENALVARRSRHRETLRRSRAENDSNEWGRQKVMIRNNNSPVCHKESVQHLRSMNDLPRERLVQTKQLRPTYTSHGRTESPFLSQPFKTNNLSSSQESRYSNQDSHYSNRNPVTYSGRHLHPLKRDSTFQAHSKKTTYKKNYHGRESSSSRSKYQGFSRNPTSR